MSTLRTHLSFALDVFLVGIVPGAPVCGQSASPPAENTGTADEVKTIHLILHPSDEPVPALKFQLVPPFNERHTGNAAIHYYKAIDTTRLLDFSKFHEQADLWLEMPIDKVPMDELTRTIGGAGWGDTSSELSYAARCNRCDWEVRTDLGVRLLIPEVDMMRNLGVLVALRARYQIARGELDEALTTLQIGFAMARHVAAGPTLINALVGLSIQETMCVQLSTLLQQPSAPNLYWALTVLPDPLVDLRPAIEAEMYFWIEAYPVLKDPASAQRTPDQWQRGLTRLVQDLDEFDSGAEKSDWRARVLLLGYAASAYPQAKRRLLAAGYSLKKIEAMPVAQVIVIDAVRTYEELRDDMMRWGFVPRWQAEKGLLKDRQCLEEASSRETIPLASSFLPAVDAATRAAARHQRRLASLRIVEALRLYMARHGRLPNNLNEIDEVPVPLDAVTGRAFDYSVSGQTAVLAGPDLPSVSSHYKLRYELHAKNKDDSR